MLLADCRTLVTETSEATSLTFMPCQMADLQTAGLAETLQDRVGIAVTPERILVLKGGVSSQIQPGWPPILNCSVHHSLVCQLNLSMTAELRCNAVHCNIIFCGPHRTCWHWR